MKNKNIETNKENIKEEHIDKLNNEEELNIQEETNKENIKEEHIDKLNNEEELNIQEETNEDNNPFINKVSNINSIPKFISFFIKGSLRVFLILILIVLFLILIYIANSINAKSFKKNIKKYYCYFLLYFLSFKNINVKNYEKVANSKANIIISNHSSIIDILVLIYLVPEIKLVIDSKEELLNLYLLNDILKDFIIYSDELNENNIIEKIENNNIKLLYFSEGCLSRCDILLKLQDNAFKFKKNILPIHLKYEEKAMWIDSNLNLYDYIFDLLSKNKSIVDVEILDDFDYNKDKNINENIEDFRNIYSKNTGVILSNLSYQDHPYFENKY